MDVRIGLSRRLSAEELMCLNCGVGEDLRVPWTARRSNQSILKEIGPGILATSFEDLTLKSLMLGGIENRRRRGQQRMRLAGWHHRLSGHEFG